MPAKQDELVVFTQAKLIVDLRIPENAGSRLSCVWHLKLIFF